MKNNTQYCLSLFILAIAILAGQYVSAQFEHYLDSLRANELYEYTYSKNATGSIQTLQPGDSEYTVLQLANPISFYGDKYNQLYINTNGILTFNVEFPEYLNQPFPLEYPSIAPFYSNVDTSEGPSSTEITLFHTQDAALLQKAQKLVRFAYNGYQDFEAKELIVATWRDVGYFDSKFDRLNTFQVALIVNNEQTFVQFIYPAGGLNWLQGEAGSLGLPDIRAQAGFVAEDGRFFNLEGSASENALFLSDSSNLGIPGVWLYRVGPLLESENVQSPDNAETRTDAPTLAHSCSEAGHTCHINAQCFDKSEGYCCICNIGFYGNGRVCIKDDYPIRVTGTISGEINGQPVDERAKLQSYIVTSDARSYTAVNPVNAELGAQLRLILPLVTNIGWLFAKPVNGALNGYQLTGGNYLHTSRIHYDSGEVLIVNQTYEGLNYWDQLAVKTELFGEVPNVLHTLKLHMGDYIDEYRFVSPNELHSVHSHTLEIPEEHRVISLQIDQTIIFQRCLRDEDLDPTDTTVLQKVSKLVLDYFERDQALRTSALNKIGVYAESNACTDGSAQCGENTVCVPYEDTYRCDCLHGYEPQLDERGLETCVDIDECALGTHVCDDHALCSNSEGGFNCVCLDGYEGNGYRCLINNTADNIEYSTPPIYDLGVNNGLAGEHIDYPPYESSHQHLDECQRCSSDANCVEGHCVCRDGFSGDGYNCAHICGHDEVLENGRCVPILFDDHVVEPHCNFMGECVCPDGYELSDDTYKMCRYAGHYDVERSEDLVPCDVDANCHINATCAWYEHELRHICTCNPGLSGDGHYCEPIDESCAVKPEICDAHAVCQYNELIGKSECQCERGYTGDGYRCQLTPECQTDVECGDSAYCDSGVCQCNSGYERDMIKDVCVPVGRCGIVFCGPNALCKWDAAQSVQYCDCMEGYEGDALVGCKSLPIPCNVRNNCGIHATCEPTEDPARYECQCNAGYHGDGYICSEDQNCLNNPTMCDMNADCRSTSSGLVCVCKQGFYGNGSLCLERQQHDSGFLLVSQGVVIVRVPLNGRNVLPISVASMAIGLDKDCVEGRVYWGDISAKKIVSAKYDGSDARAFINEDIESPEGIAIDAISRRIYWTDSVKDTIEVASLDDANLRAVIINKNLVNPRGIAVDAHKQKLYWSDWDRESPKIEMSDLDGTDRELLLGKESVTLPNSLVVLEQTGELCYADAGSKKVECIEAYSRQRRTISNDLSYPFGLAFTQNQFYWTDWTTKKLESVNDLGVRQKAIQTPFFGSHKMYGMTAVEQYCPQVETPCHINNGGCADSRLCLVNHKAPSGKSCKCTLLSKTCTVPQFGVYA